LPDEELIQFHFEEVDKITLNFIKYREWIIRIIKSEGFLPGFLNIIFTSDICLHGINKEYLGKDYYTDVIAFDFSDEYNGKISGDIFISKDRVADNAKQMNHSFEEELKRVIAHGILHLLGYKDSTKKLKEDMTNKENLYLKKYSP